MAQSYFTDFWIITTSGTTLFPAKIKDRTTGVVAYRTLAKGSNEKQNGREYADPVDAVAAFLAGASLRFGNDSTPDNRFDIDGPKTMKVGATAAFQVANPHLKF